VAFTVREGRDTEREGFEPSEAPESVFDRDVLELLPPRLRESILVYAEHFRGAAR
jgi:hypothetical protein